MLVVGIPKEIKPQEKRVAITPAGVRDLAADNIVVVVQKGAGAGSGYPDEEYRDAGAEILPDAQDIYRSAGLIKKVKEPLPPEFPFFKKNQVLFCFLHLVSPENRKLVEALLAADVTALGYETVEKEGTLPILLPMSRIAGALAASYAAYFRKNAVICKNGITYRAGYMSHLEEIAKAYPGYSEDLELGNVVIFGGGNAGRTAMEYALHLKGKVTLVEKNGLRRQEILKESNSDLINLKVIAPEELSESLLAESDVCIGCVHRVGERAPHVIDAVMLRAISRKKKKILMDIAIDQGGNFPESHATSYKDPLYKDSAGNMRFAVPNIPSLCGKGASEALEKVTLTYTLAMAKDVKKALLEFPELQKAINIHRGKITHPAVRAACGNED